MKGIKSGNTPDKKAENIWVYALFPSELIWDFRFSIEATTGK